MHYCMNQEFQRSPSFPTSLEPFIEEPVFLTLSKYNLVERQMYKLMCLQDKYMLLFKKNYD